MPNAESALEAADSGGALAAIAELITIPDPLESAQAFHAAMRSAYWDRKDVALVIALGHGGIARALGAAPTSDDAHELRSMAKACAYDIASFTWPGWDEPGIEVSSHEITAGVAAARMNLQWAIDLEKGILPESRAHWMLGACLLAVGDHAAAGDSFASAAKLAERAGARAEARLSEAFAALAAELGGDAAAGLVDAIDRLRDEEDGDAFVSQVETARRVFSS